MEELYLDNFRGFKKTFIPIKQINFLVGENSTGKTTVLSALKILKDADIIPNIRFNDDYISLGSFREIVPSSETTTFRLGVLFKTDKTDNALIFEFGNRKNIPYVKRIIFIDPEEILELLFEEEKLLARSRKFRRQIDINSIKKKILDIDPSSRSSGYIKIDAPTYMPIEYIIYRASNLVNKKKASPPLFRFHSFKLHNKPFFWIAPIRAKPSRFYESLSTTTSPDGTHTPSLIRSMLNNKNSTADKGKEALNSYGDSSGLYKDIKIKSLDSSNEDSIFSIAVKVKRSNFRISNVGYGVSQSLPIIMEMILGKKESIYIIQQPEVHLHPKAQATIGELIHRFANDDDKSFFVETHSDYLIDRYRIRLAKHNKNITSQILYFENKNDQINVHPIKIDDKGGLHDVPDRYRDFFIQEQLNLLDL